MRIKKAFWACSLALPATIIPLSTATSCSQVWGYKTPLSIGTNTKGDILDPFYKFADESTYGKLVDLSGEAIVPYLQSNYAVDCARTVYYGYGLPQKWDEKLEKDGWKGGFVDGSAGWYNTSSSLTMSGVKKKDNKSETVYSYRNNMLPSNSALIGQIATNISQYVNYALQYQGTQIGNSWNDDENLAIAWGTTSLNHGKKEGGTTQEKLQNQQFFESIYASNAVSGTGKSEAVVHPTHVAFNFQDGYFPIAAYVKDGDKIVVSPTTKILLNGADVRPSGATVKYWSTKSKEFTEKVVEGTTTKEYKYVTYTYTNVPVLVSFNAYNKSYVNPTKNDSFLVDDYYSDTKAINKAVGDTWKNSIGKYTGGDEKPTLKAFSYETSEAGTITPTKASENKADARIKNPTNNSFIVLLNYSYKECTSSPSTPEMDRVTMSDLVGVFPAYFCDSKLGLEETFFKTANDESGAGYIFDVSKLNKYNSLYADLMKRTSGQGLVTKAKDLNDTSKKLLRFLSYMFGDADYKIDTSTFFFGQPLDAE